MAPVLPPSLSSIGKQPEASTIRFSTKPCVGHYDMGGMLFGVSRRPTKLERWAVRKLLGWVWTEEYSDVHEERALRMRELS